MNIFLIGYRCTGKTAVGRRLSHRLGLSFMDADVELESAYGLTIRQIVSSEGWDVFRKMERSILEQLCRQAETVVATGGGVVMVRGNVEMMRASGVLVWLQASAETIRKRMLADVKTALQRPALTRRDLDDEIEQTLSRRLPLYAAAMDFKVETDRLDIDAVSDQLRDKLKAYGIGG